ncbi:MAG: Bug family tripartite tricarboxylate transporter substrate binding protein [Xanthobacteraceae bacterium]
MTFSLLVMTENAHAQDYPNKPVKIITQGAAGSGPDVVARIVFDQLSRLWGQQIVIVNAPGAGGSTAARQAATAAPDGYSLYMPAASAFIVMPEMFPTLPVNIFKDFTSIGFVAEQPFVIAVAPSLGVNSVAEFVALSKKKPGEINYAANSRGTLPSLTAERFRTETGADLTFIPYPGAAAGLQDLMGGRIAMIVEGLGTLMGSIQSGALKPIAITSLQRLPSFPDLPTVAETVPGFLATGWFALSAPVGTPDAIVRKVNQDLKTAVENPETRKKLADLATFVRPMSPEETTAFVRKEQDVWSATVRKVGFSSQ